MNRRGVRARGKKDEGWEKVRTEEREKRYGDRGRVRTGKVQKREGKKK